jgi:hypothetical protein
MIEFLVSLIVLCIVFGLIYYLVTMLPLPDPFKRVAVIAVLLIFILILLASLTGHLRLPTGAWGVR